MTRLDYGQVGTAIDALRGETVVLVRKDVDKAAAGLLEALLQMHNETAIELEHFPEVDAFARKVVVGDFDCCATGTPGVGTCACGCGLPIENAAALDEHMGRRTTQAAS